MEKITTGICLKRPTSPTPCDSCAVTKSVRLLSGNSTTDRDFLPFEKVGCDIWSHSTPSIRGFYHLLGFTCYRTGHLNVYLMKTKDQSAAMLEEYLRWLFAQNRKVVYMRCDSDPIFKGH